MRIEYFQLVDRITALDLKTQTIHAEAVVPTASTIFEGHFPDHPLMPGVLLIECMAQTSGWLLIGHTKFERMPFLAAVKEAKLRTFVTPGQTLSVSATLTHEGSGYMITAASIRCAGKAVCEATMTLRLMAFPTVKLRNSMEELARRIAFPMEAVPHA